MKSKKPCSALTIGELVILVVVVIVFIALLPPAISLVRKRGRQINDVSNGKRVAAALRYFAGVGASPATAERPPSRFVTTTRSVSLDAEELPPGTHQPQQQTNQNPRAKPSEEALRTTRRKHPENENQSK